LTSGSTENVLLRQCEETGSSMQQLFVEAAEGLKKGFRLPFAD
jgi:hypothetical protein